MTLSYAGLERQLFLQWRPVYDSSACTHAHTHTFLILVSGQLQHSCCTTTESAAHPPKLPKLQKLVQTLWKRKNSLTTARNCTSISWLSSLWICRATSHSSNMALCNLTARNTAIVVNKINKPFELAE